MVKIFAKADGFVSHRQTNADDLTLKYEYLYSFSHKVLAEAKAIMVKRKYDPDATANNYLALGANNDTLLGGAELMMLSESSDSSDDSDLSEIDQEEIEKAELIENNQEVSLEIDMAELEEIVSQEKSESLPEEIEFNLNDLGS